MRFITEAVAAAGLPSWVTAIVLLFGALGTVGGFTGLAALLTMRRSGRKIEADTAKTLTETAVLLIKPLDDRINGLEAEVTDLREALNHRDQLAAEHSGWDYIVEQLLKVAGVMYPPRPPLIPPPRPVIGVLAPKARPESTTRR